MASPTIRHIAIFSENPAALAKFYGDVFGISITGVDDLGNARHWNAEIERQPIHAQAERLHKVRTQNLAGMDGRKKFFALRHG